MSDDITKACMLNDWETTLPQWIVKYMGTPFYKEALEIELESMREVNKLRDEERALDLGGRGPEKAAAREVVALKIWAESLEYASEKEKLAIRYVAWLHAGASIDEAKRTAEIAKAQEVLSKALPKKGEPKNSHEHPPKGYPEHEGSYADPKNHKYPLDTEKHVRAAISYFSVAKNAAEYSSAEQKTMWGRIHAAAKKHGIEISDLKKGEDDIDKGVNPWAVCHASTGPGKTEKFESCVQDVKKKEGIHKGEDVEKAEKLHGGKGDNVPDSHFDAKCLKAGTEHEMEHTKDRKVAKEIAKDHLMEDPNYYKKLGKIEKAIDTPPAPGPSAPSAATPPPPVTKSEEDKGPKKTSHIVAVSPHNIVIRDLSQAQQKAAAMLKAQQDTEAARASIRAGLTPTTKQYGGFASGYRFGPGSGK